MHGKRYQEASALIDKKTVYSLQEAVVLAKKTATTKFDSTIELHISLGIDPRKGDQQIRGTIMLPHSSGESKKKIAAFVAEGKEKEAKAAGADIVGGEEMIAKIGQTGKIDFDIAVATPDMMPKLAKIAKILGPRGLMPNPKTDTVGPDVVKMVSELKKGKTAFKNDPGGNIHIAVGKASMSEADLLENIQAMLDSLKRNRPASAKGTYFKKLVLASTMGPSIHFAEEK